MNPCIPEPPARESLPGVQRICEICWSPIPWGQVSWQPIADTVPPAWECLCTACLLAGTERSAA
jgi:hypothetical protein